MQFHTPESFAAKTETHALYEEARLPDTDPARVQELTQSAEQYWRKPWQATGYVGVTIPTRTEVAAR